MQQKSKKIQVLLIEDDSDDALMLEETLAEVDKEFKVKLDWVESLEEGLDRIGSGAYDMVFLDLSLPGTHGIDTFLSLHDRFPQVPVVILTGFTHDSFADEARQKGAHDYLVKGDVDGETLTRLFREATE